MSTELTCASCGELFTPAPKMLERYPGWKPRECPRCYRAKGAKPSAGSDASGAVTGGTPAAAGTHGRPGERGSTRDGGRPRGSGGRRSRGGQRGGGSQRAGIEEHLTIAEVLEKYTDGPDDGVFTDGAASPNPGPGGWGAVWVVDGEVRAQDHGHEPHTTNNRMELTALHRGIELVPEGTPAVVYSDSNLVVRTVNEWAAGWERRGWKRKTGPVENLDLVRPLYELVRSRPEIDVVWIRAHAGNRWNEYADALATAYARDEL